MVLFLYFRMDYAEKFQTIEAHIVDLYNKRSACVSQIESLIMVIHDLDYELTKAIHDRNGLYTAIQLLQHIDEQYVSTFASKPDIAQEMNKLRIVDAKSDKLSRSKSFTNIGLLSDY